MKQHVAEKENTQRKKALCIFGFHSLNFPKILCVSNPFLATLWKYLQITKIIHFLTLGLIALQIIENDESIE